MISLNDVKTIFIDYDGTLHNSIFIYAPAFLKAYDYLVMQGLAEKREWTNKEISYWLGFNPPDMWKTFLPDLNVDYREQCSNIIAKEMKLHILEGRAKWYQGALDTLEYLKNKGYHLIFLSNCKQYYLDCHLSLFALDRYFEALLCSEQFEFRPKDEIIRKVRDRYPEPMIVIGDRRQDIEAGKQNNMKTIGCSYGFSLEGELKEADILIDDIRELKYYL
jgi:phosphoglycolate phosphatase